MSDHPWNDWRVTAYALDELDEAARAAFERELSADPALQEAVAEALRITRAVTVSLGREPAPALSDAHRAELFSHFSGEGPMNAPAPNDRAGRRGRTGLRLALAASLCLILGGAVWIATTRSPIPQEVALLGQEKERAPADEAAEGESASPAPGVPADPAERVLTESPPAAGPVRSARQNLGRESAEAAVTGEGLSGQPSAGSPYAGPAGQGGYSGQGSAAGSSYGMAPGGMGGMGGGMRGRGGGMGGAAGDELNFRQRASGAVPLGVAHDLFAGADIKTARQLQRSPAGYGEGYGAQGGYGPVEASERAGGYGDAAEADRGRGPGQAGDRFEPITDNPFLRVADNPLSTFSIDVDTASYSKVRQYLLEQNQLPRPDAVRIEELINYFEYDYQPPAEDAEHPFAAALHVASCPWNPEHRLARIGIQGRTVENGQRPPSNLVFLLDVSGSMNQPNKLPLVRRGMQLLLEQLGENDRVAIVVYAGAAGMVLESTPASRRQEIFDALERLRAGGSTNGGQGIQLAYATARDHFISGGTNRVILCTDGDFNVGTTGTDQLVRMVEKEAKGGIFLSVLGFGMGNHNDAMLEQISGRGNGNYAFIDTENEARKVLVQQTAGTLVTIAKDVKIQVEFNPNRVAGYRLIGYENRLLAKEDFNDDTKDAGEIGAGHTVTALYELVPAGEPVEAAAPDVDPLKYQTPAATTEAAESDELLTLKLRYKQPDGDESTLIQFPAEDSGQSFDAQDRDFQFAAAVAGFGMLLRDSPYKGNWTFAAVEEIAAAAQGEDPYGFRGEFLSMVQKAAELAGE